MRMSSKCSPPTSSMHNNSDTPPLLGVVTAVGRPEYNLLHAAGASLRQLADCLVNRIPVSGSQPVLEWALCCDGAADGPVDPVAVHAAVRSLELPVYITAIGRRVGPGPCRNQALA